MPSQLTLQFSFCAWTICRTNKQATHRELQSSRQSVYSLYILLCIYTQFLLNITSTTSSICIQPFRHTKHSQQPTWYSISHAIHFSTTILILLSDAMCKTTKIIKCCQIHIHLFQIKQNLLLAQLTGHIILKLLQKLKYCQCSPYNLSAIFHLVVVKLSTRLTRLKCFDL